MRLNIIIFKIKTLFNILFTNYSNKKRITKHDPSETKHSAFYSGVIKNKTEFNEWLVGVTDGDGTFYFNKNKKGVWNFTFKIGQSNYNLRLLYYIKSMIGVGSVSIPDSKDNTAEFRIRNIQHIIQHILPIFDNHPLLTSKHFSYSLFKEAILISANGELSKDIKENLINELKIKFLKGLPSDYVSPAWKITGNSVNSIKEAMKVMSKSWLIGFTETNGNFLTINKNGIIEYVFEIYVQSSSINDQIVLLSISKILKIKNILLPLTIKNCGCVPSNKIRTNNNKTILNIINFYINSFKGMKALEYRI